MLSGGSSSSRIWQGAPCSECVSAARLGRERHHSAEELGSTVMYRGQPASKKGDLTCLLGKERGLRSSTANSITTRSHLGRAGGRCESTFQPFFCPISQHGFQLLTKRDTRNGHRHLRCSGGAGAQRLNYTGCKSPEPESSALGKS